MANELQSKTIKIAQLENYSSKLMHTIREC